MKLQKTFSTPDGGHYFSGYYDKSPLNGGSTRVLAQRAGFMDRLVRKGETLEIGYFDFPHGTQFHKFAETKAWNWQQGCQLQWRGPGFNREVIFNDVRNGRFVSIVCDVDTGKERELPLPIYSVSADGKWAVCIDYERHYWCRPAYNYMGVENTAKRKNLDPDDGIWLLSLESGECHKIILFADLLAKHGVATMSNGPNYLEHLMFNPSGNRFCFLHRWHCGDGGILSHFFTANQDGSDIFLLNETGIIGHFCWNDDDSILGFGTARNPLQKLRRYRWATKYVMRPLLPLYHALFPPTSSIALGISGGSYLLFKDRTREVTKIAAAFLNDNGHMTFRPGSRSIFVTDTYPDEAHTYKLMLVDIVSRELLVSESLRSMAQIDATGYRCDLHPKWSFDGRFVFVDTVNDGHRGIYSYRLDQRSIWADSE
jgi:hypothetical protein